MARPALAQQPTSDDPAAPAGEPAAAGEPNPADALPTDSVARSALVIPLTGDVPPAQADIVLGFNLALAELSGHSGAEVTVAQTNLDDTMAAVGCVERSSSCLAQVATALDVERIVYGEVRVAGPHTYDITLTVARADPGQPLVEHRFVVRVQDPLQAEAAFTNAAPDELLDARPAAATANPDATGSGDGGPNGATDPQSGRDIAYSYDVDRVHHSTWIVVGAGAATATMGTIFWLLARNGQQDIDSFTVANPDDLSRLRALEDRTQTRATIGNVLVSVGLVTLAVGAALGYAQARVAIAEPDDAGALDADGALTFTVTPLVSPRSAGATLLVRWLY